MTNVQVPKIRVISPSVGVGRMRAATKDDIRDFVLASGGLKMDRPYYLDEAARTPANVLLSVLQLFPKVLYQPSTWTVHKDSCYYYGAFVKKHDETVLGIGTVSPDAFSVIKGFFDESTSKALTEYAVPVKPAQLTGWVLWGNVWQLDHSWKGSVRLMEKYTSKRPSFAGLKRVKPGHIIEHPAGLFVDQKGLVRGRFPLKGMLDLKCLAALTVLSGPRNGWCQFITPLQTGF